MLGTDVVVAKLQRFAQRQLKNFFGARREGDMATGRGATLANDLFDLITNGFKRDAKRFECLGGNTLAFVNQTEQDVLGTDVVVVKQPRFFLCKHNNSAGSVCESFEHEAFSCLSSKVGRV